MIRHDPTWLCPGRTRLYINYLGKVYRKNALDFHLWNPCRSRDISDVSAQVYCSISVHTNQVNGAPSLAHKKNA